MAQLKGFTILETLVAMALVVLAFSGGMMIFLNVQKSSDEFRKMKASFIVEQLHVKTKEQKALIDDSFDLEQLHIEKQVEPYSEGSSAYVVNYDVSGEKDKKPIYQFKAILIE